MTSMFSVLGNSTAGSPEYKATSHGALVMIGAGGIRVRISLQTASRLERSTS